MGFNKKIGFDSQKYLREQTKYILQRVKGVKGKLYLEFGGKILCDYHAARVLPGFDPNAKIKLLQKLKKQADLILCISAIDIERKKVRADFGLTYDLYILMMINELKNWGLDVVGVVITRFTNQPSALIFKDKLERQGIKVYLHQPIKDYPHNLNLIVSDLGYGLNDYLQTKKPLVIITGPGPGGGKLGTCLSQLYHDYKKGIKSGYAKFETFPIWNLPLNHPVNMAYEAATADLGDFNQVDPFHLKTYQEKTINYNRDVEAFPVVEKILKKITGKVVYQSPTEMGVNRAGFCITNDKVVKEAAQQEIIRRYFKYHCEYITGLTDRKTISRIESILKKLNLKPEDRPVVKPAREKATKASKKRKNNHQIVAAAALELKEGLIVTGKSSSLMSAASSTILNAIKVLAKIPDRIHLLSPKSIKSINRLKKDYFYLKDNGLNLEETLIALSMSVDNNPSAKKALRKLKELNDSEMHLTHLPQIHDEAALRRLEINFTSDPKFPTKGLFVI